jgi:DNA helicase-2/ATP-dependent DNA helicase PcrA
MLEKYQKMFKYMLIDEYQDTNKAQYIAINLLAKAHQNLCVVGDDAQSIYRWRGADISNILEFNKDYPYSKVIRLEQNYRSTKTIIEAAHNVIKNNQNQIPKNLWTENPEGEKINILQCADDREEAFKISTIIQKEIKNGHTLNNIAVLYRTNAQSLALENSLRSQNLPYIIVGGISFYKRKEIKDVLAYITLLLNSKDNEAFIRAVNEPPRGIGQTSLRYLRAYAEYNSMTLLSAAENAENIPELKGKASVATKQFAEMINKYKKLIEENLSNNLITEYLAETGIIDMYREIGSDDSLDRLNNIEQLLTDLFDYLDKNPESGIIDYLQQISLVTDMDDKDLNGNNITLMTLHSAKGLEYPVVILAGVEKGLFPLERTRLNQEEEEEERRLFYVGITRAKKKLYLTYAMRRAKFGEITNQGASKFIREIPVKLTNLSQSTGMTPVYTKPVASSSKQTAKTSFDNYSQISNDDDYSQIPVNDKPLKVGDKVKHSNFGHGRIIQITGYGSQTKAIVNFDRIGNKVLMLSFAKLDRV